MKKNGFTLVELLAVLVLMVFIMLISSYSIGAANERIKARLWENKKKLIINAAERWGEDNKSKLPSLVSVEHLLERRYLSSNESDGSDKVVINNVTGKNVNGCAVKVDLENDLVYATYDENANNCK